MEDWGDQRRHKNNEYIRGSIESAPIVLLFYNYYAFQFFSVVTYLDDVCKNVKRLL